MNASIEIKSQGTRGKNWTLRETRGAVEIRVDYDGTKDARIYFDAYEGKGSNYKKRETTLLNIHDGKGIPVFVGTFDQLIEKLK